jgi:hypothetical protein
MFVSSWMQEWDPRLREKLLATFAWPLQYDTLLYTNWISRTCGPIGRVRDLAGSDSGPATTCPRTESARSHHEPRGQRFRPIADHRATLRSSVRWVQPADSSGVVPCMSLCWAGPIGLKKALRSVNMVGQLVSGTNSR